jgi:trehalose-6-phosphatase
VRAGPALASKARTVEYLMARDPWPGAVPVYFGDDNRDEHAFVAARALGGLGIVVAASAVPGTESRF